MNVIAMINGREYVNAGMLKALETLKIEKLFVLENEKTPWKNFQNLKLKCGERYDNVETHEMKYEERIEYCSQIPLDAKLLKSFEPYMLTALKMLERTREYDDIPFEERITIVLTHLKYWNTIIEKHKIDLYVGIDVPHGGYNYVIYALCKIKDIKTIFMANCSAMGYSYTLTNIEEHCPELKVEYDKLLKEYENTPTEDIVLCEIFEEEYRKQVGDNDDDKVPYYMLDLTLPDSYNMFKMSKQKSKKFVTDFSWIMKMITGPRNFKNTAKAYNFYRNTNKYYDTWNSFVKPIDMQNEKYIYFPLHYQPESTTTPAGGFYAWQYYAVALLNSVLPKDIFIYVKENPKQTFQARSFDFPEKLSKLSNVKLVDTAESTYKLIENSIAVSTITGTAIWEGLYTGKPGIMFGHFITQYAPGVFKVTTLEECKSAVEKILHQNCAPTHREMRIFSKAMENTTYFGFVDREPLIEQYGEEKSADGICNVLVHAFEKYKVY